MNTYTINLVKEGLSEIPKLAIIESEKYESPLDEDMASYVENKGYSIEPSLQLETALISITLYMFLESLLELNFENQESCEITDLALDDYLDNYIDKIKNKYDTKAIDDFLNKDINYKDSTSLKEKLKDRIIFTFLKCNDLNWLTDISDLVTMAEPLNDALMNDTPFVFPMDPEVKDPAYRKLGTAIYEENNFWNEVSTDLLYSIKTSAYNCLKNGEIKFSFIDMHSYSISSDPLQVQYKNTISDEEFRKLSSLTSSNPRCFIATATYGTPIAREVIILKKWRDEKLMNTHAGKNFVTLYYKYSPLIANYIRKSDFLKKTIAVVLKPLIKSLKNNYKG